VLTVEREEPAMLIDGNIGGSVDGTEGGDLSTVHAQVDAAERAGLDGVWSTEVAHDPFLPLLLAARQSSTLRIGTAVAVAFARNPMTTAMTAYDLHAFSAGRFILGLGSQIEAHIRRRFAMPWSAPAPRMREFIAALRAIWASWQTGDPLDFRGDFYQHTLMTPMFQPAPHPYGTPPVLVAAVGPRMTRMASTAADGLLVHAFTSERYLREVTVPTIEAGLCETGRTRAQFTVSYPALLACAADEPGMAAAVDAVRRQLAFYASTPAYRPVLDLHGWGELQPELRRLFREGKSMRGLIDDTMLHTFAVVGEPQVVGKRLRQRFAGLVDRLTLFAPYPMGDDVRAEVVAALRH
jgi:probable F420-dependent oxidoreductase